MSVLLLVLLCLPGCSNNSNRPDLVPVRGQVTLDSEPLPEALVVFRSQEGVRASRAITASDGSYELTYLRDIKGAPPGKNTVTVTTAKEGNRTERVPKKYNAESTLVVTVPGDDGVINLDLTTK